MAMRGGRTVPGYQDHYLLNGGKARISLHYLITPGDASKNNALLDQHRRTVFCRHRHPRA
jgi:hypothetical protein